MAVIHSWLRGIKKSSLHPPGDGWENDANQNPEPVFNHFSGTRPGTVDGLFLTLGDDVKKIMKWMMHLLTRAGKHTLFDE